MSPFSSSLEPRPITRELDTGERLLWSGRPDPKRMWRRQIPLALFSLPVGAFMAFWMWGASASLRSALAAAKTPGFIEVIFPAFGLFGAGAVVFMALSPWLEAARARRTFYALTDRRALLVVEGFKREVKSVSPLEFSLERRDFPGGLGDLVLKRDTDNETSTETGFYGIVNAWEVERLARDLAKRG